MKHLLPVGVLLLLLFSGCNNDPHTYVVVDTDFGSMRLKLYESTPQHRDNFIKLANEGFYNDLLFHRVIDGFMVQGGDPDSRNAPPGKVLGMGGPGYEVPAEFNLENVHVKGALAAARNNNPQKNSSGSQFYIVHGRQVDVNLLNRLEQNKGIKYTPEQRQAYLQYGGAPILDNDYTVFGELVEGFEVLDKIATQATGRSDRPTEDIKMQIRVE